MKYIMKYFATYSTGTLTYFYAVQQVQKKKLLIEILSGAN